jgi:hypothetical protein
MAVLSIGLTPMSPTIEVAPVVEIPDFDRITKLPAVPRFTGAIVAPVVVVELEFDVVDVEVVVELVVELEVESDVVLELEVEDDEVDEEEAIVELTVDVRAALVLVVVLVLGGAVVVVVDALVELVAVI